MKFPSIGKQRGYTVTVPQLSGGLNKSVPAHLIEDNQLSEVKNMWYQNGMLQTRPGLCEVGQRAVESGCQYMSTTQLKDKLCVMSLRAVEGSGTAQLVFTFFDYEGQPVGAGNIVIDLQTDMDVPEQALIVENAGRLSCDAIVYVPRRQEQRAQAYGINASAGSAELLDFYTPTVIMNGEPTVEKQYTLNGDQYEPYNLLDASFKCLYTSNGKGAYYSFPKQSAADFLQIGDEIKVTYISGQGEIPHTLRVTEITEDGIYRESEKQEDGYQLVFESKLGMFYFTGLKPVETPETEEGAETETAAQTDGEEPETEPEVIYEEGDVALPYSSFVGNIELEIRLAKSESAELICGMKLSAWFGGGSSSLTGGSRLFVAGDTDKRNLLHWSALNDPLYFPENNYAYVGDNTQKITALGKQNELLVIFKENEMYCSYYVQGTMLSIENVEEQAVEDVEAARASFPIYTLSPNIGCDLPATVCLCNNRLVWFNSNKRVYGLFTTGQYSERNVRVLSNPINTELEQLDDVSGAVATEWESNYLLHVGGVVYVMDYSSAGFVYYSSYSSDEKAQKAVAWYRWALCEDGAVPTILATATGASKTVYITKQNDAYSTLLYNNETFCDVVYGVQVPVRSSFCTKLYDFDRPDLKKAIQQLYLSIRDDVNSVIRITYHTERWRDEDAYTITGVGEKAYIRTCRLTPNIRLAETFGVSCDSDTGMAVQGIMLKYKHQGVVN